jgi:hypothetical protein
MDERADAELAADVPLAGFRASRLAQQVATVVGDGQGMVA